jgi:hypothetical protein
MYFMTDLDAVRLSPLPSMEIMYQAYVLHRGNILSAFFFPASMNG